jgi:hypothetical protein
MPKNSHDAVLAVFNAKGLAVNAGSFINDLAVLGYEVRAAAPVAKESAPADEVAADE